MAGSLLNWFRTRLSGFVAIDDVCIEFSSITSRPSVTAFMQTNPSISATVTSRTSITGEVSSGC